MPFGEKESTTWIEFCVLLCVIDNMSLMFGTNLCFLLIYGIFSGYAQSNEPLLLDIIPNYIL